MDAPVNDEAAKDPGAQQPHHQGFSDEDFEGHRAGSVFVGVHIPGNRRHSHHRRHHKHRHEEDGDAADRPVPMLGRRGSRLGSICDDGETFTPPSQRVQFILGEDADNGAHEVHPLFSEMGELCHDGDEAEWRETARWIKFEEDVEEGGDRWSKPHVATLSLHSLFELRSLLLHGALLLDMEASSLESVADMILDNLVSSESLPEEAREKVRETLLRRHRHQHQRRRENSATNMTRLPIIRSLAEIGRNHSTSKSEYLRTRLLMYAYNDLMFRQTCTRKAKRV
ncbi:Sodium bicarbonate cotransporter 3 [Frankliniella fusca]|uniref:Sodium bicarbonate cotransporter 3 n=1 Tax=Frankliniella fusca TaxID=407009 RepID=A0AAE1LK44_9NEOP|nr:Sodium bicarbonate cotransporter 3 [Frankliniella fusca]